MVGCRAQLTFKWPINSTLSPSSSMTNSCKTVGVYPFVGAKQLRLLVNINRPPGSGHGAKLYTPGVRNPFAATPLFGVKTWRVSWVIFRVFTWTLKMSELFETGFAEPGSLIL